MQKNVLITPDRRIVSMEIDGLEACEVLTHYKFRVGKHARELLSHPSFQIGPSDKRFQLTIVSNAELSKRPALTLEETIDAGQERYLFPCRPSDAFWFRIQYKHQPVGERLLFVMRGAPDAKDKLHFFAVEHDEYGRWFFSHPANSKDIRNGNALFVFRAG